MPRGIGTSENSRYFTVKIGASEKGGIRPEEFQNLGVELVTDKILE